MAEQHIPPAKVGLDKRVLPQRSHLMRMSHDGNAANGSSIASAPVGSGHPHSCASSAREAYVPPSPVARWTNSRNNATAAIAAMLVLLGVDCHAADRHSEVSQNDAVRMRGAFRRRCWTARGSVCGVTQDFARRSVWVWQRKLRFGRGGR